MNTINKINSISNLLIEDNKLINNNRNTIYYLDREESFYEKSLKRNRIINDILDIDEDDDIKSWNDEKIGHLGEVRSFRTQIIEISMTLKSKAYFNKSFNKIEDIYTELVDMIKSSTNISKFRYTDSKSVNTAIDIIMRTSVRIGPDISILLNSKSVDKFILPSFITKIIDDSIDDNQMILCKPANSKTAEAGINILIDNVNNTYGICSSERWYNNYIILVG